MSISIIYVYSVTVMTYLIVLKRGQYIQGTPNPIYTFSISSHWSSICSKCGFGIIISEGIIDYALIVVLLVGMLWAYVMCDMEWCVTSEMRAKIRSTDWRRASELTGGISCWAGPCDSGSWSLDVAEDLRMFAVESEPYINMEWNQWCYQEYMIEERTC